MTKLGIVMAVMHVMGRLGLWAPYLRMTQMVLNTLDRACEEAWDFVWWDIGLYDIEEKVVISYES